MRIDYGLGFFYLDPSDAEFGEIHARMIADFENVEKLERFEKLLREDTNTAFEKYINFEE